MIIIKNYFKDFQDAYYHYSIACIIQVLVATVAVMNATVGVYAISGKAWILR